MSKFLHSFATENKGKPHQKLSENKDSCNVIMPSEDNKSLEFNPYQKLDKALFVIYPDLECLIENIHRCKNSPKNSFTTKVGNLPYFIRFFNVYKNHHLKR